MSADLSFFVAKTEKIMNWVHRIEALSRMQKTMMERLYLCVLATKDTKMLSNIFHLKVNEARIARNVLK